MDTASSASTFRSTGKPRTPTSWPVVRRSQPSTLDIAWSIVTPFFSRIARIDQKSSSRSWNRASGQGTPGLCGTEIAHRFATQKITDPATGDTSEYVWYHQGGPMVFEPFKADTDYFAADKQVMINLRVRDLDSLLARLRAAGIAITQEQEMEGLGRFARVHDPEDNAIELWEPAAT